MPPKPLTPPSTPSPKAPDQNFVRLFFDQFKSLASNAGLDAILAIYNENNKLADQLKVKDQDIAKLNEKMEGQERNQGIALEGVLETHEREKARHKETKDNVQRLETIILGKEKYIAERNKVVDDLGKQLKKLQSDNEKERDRLAQAQKNIKDLQKSIQEKETTIKQMKVVEADLEGKLASTKKRFSDLEEKATATNGLLETTRASLKKLEGYAVGYSTVTEDSAIESFCKLWSYATTEIFGMLKNDLPANTLGITSAWEKLRQRELARTYQIPLPCSNTLAAKQMRLALILAILAREINKHIFLPAYIAPVDNENNLFRKALNNEAALNSEKESFCRSILLSLDPPTQESICLEGIQTVVKNVSEYFYELLSEEQRPAFHNTLSKVVQNAAAVWKPIQRSKRRYELDFDPPTADDECEVFMFPSSNNAPKEKTANQKNPNKTYLTVFPRVSIIENEEMTVYTAPIQLNSSQPQWVAAESEMNKEPATPTFGRRFMLRKPSTPKSTSVSNGGSKKGNGA
ncbi:hypothetical protein BDV38DRAFT_280897 [Aspergillus pseudotamarii]|uniref:MEI5 protein n=1 Tax=Aspergillus pseudotamarii TaxID=132259 RepID=A0A5N6T1A8_ASPPS|nr:uncharacterized protein BDV38DRAFT_280897 [Aspergillus pseudotamarii]KAE8139544.1 hypothetical protein BDV38DRAFT_280897 [Aspergillus pseudotamarii]